MATGERLRSIDRYGRLVLGAVYVALLAGRFTPARLGAFPAWDVRWFGVLIIGMACVVWVTIASEANAKVGTGALFAWFLAWVSWMALSAVWAPRGSRIGDVLVDLGLLVGFCWVGWSVAGRVHPRVLGAVWWWLYGTGWVYLAGALASGPGVQGRYSAFGGGPNVFVRIMGLAFVATLVLAATRRTGWVLLGLPAFLLGAYLSGSRGGLAALVIVLVVGGPALIHRMGGRTAGALLLGTLPVVVLAAAFYDPAWLTFGKERFIEETLGQGYDSGRRSIGEVAFHLFDTHFYAGTGLDGFYVLQGPESVWEYPHNLFLATAAEGGVIGLTLLLGAVLAGAAGALRWRPLGDDTVGFLLAALLVFVAAAFSGDYYDSRFLWFFLGLAVITARHRQYARMRAAAQAGRGAAAPRQDEVVPASSTP